MKWIDAHCHPQLSPPTVQKMDLDSWTGHTLLACATGLPDIDPLLRIQTVHPHVQVCMGWHPWKVSDSLSPDTLNKTCSMIATHIEHSHTPIGEIGLDLHPKWRSSVEQQKQVLSYFLDLALQLHRPIILHVVRSHHEILRYLRAYPSLKLYLHDFKGSPEIVQQYLKYDVFFGFSVLNSGLRYHKLARSIPPERVLLESDGLLSLSGFQDRCHNEYLSSILQIHHANFSQFCQ